MGAKLNFATRKKGRLAATEEPGLQSIMKILLAILLFVIAETQSLSAQTTTLTMLSNTTQIVTIPAGQVFGVLTWTDNGSGNSWISFTPTTGLTPDKTLPQNTVIAGPRTVTVNAGQNGLICTYKLSVDSQTANQNVASQAVVIPSNATANADIIFESSPDLVNWTAAVAGSYAPTTPNRFFRVRLVTH